jgi:hypothetical protein
MLNDLILSFPKEQKLEDCEDFVNSRLDVCLSELKELLMYIIQS